MSKTPALDRFERAIVSKFPGKCFFCNATTLPGTDYTALDHGKWIGVCAIHANSVVEQCKAFVVRIHAVAATLPQESIAAIDKLTETVPDEVLDGTATADDTLHAVSVLYAAVSIAEAGKPAPVRCNKFAAKCGSCKGKVAEFAGRIEKIDGKWTTFHLDGECVAKPVAVEPEKVVVPEGRYALRSDDGDVRFYRVEHGTVGSKWEGFVFVSAQASDVLYPIKNRNSRNAILDAIAADPQAAVILYGKELGVCGRCGTELTSEWRKQGIGPVCANKAW